MSLLRAPGFLGFLVLPALLLAGCGSNSSTSLPANLDPTTGQIVAASEDGPSVAETQSKGLIANVIQLLRDAATNPGGSNFDIAKDDLNQHYLHTPPSEFRLDQAEREYLERKFGVEKVKGMVTDLETPRYTFRDSRHIEDCLLLSTIARRVAGDGDDLARARRLFDWLVRQVQLVPGGALGLPNLPQAPARPYDVLLRAMATEQGSWTERSWVFLALCRQVDLDAGIVRVALPAREEKKGEPPAQAAETEKKADAPPVEPAPVPPPELATLAVAVLIEGVPYLFDCRMGMPIPGPDGNGVATLEQAMTNPAVLSQLDLPDQPYPIHQADLAAAGKVMISLDSTLGFLTPRMRVFQGELAGRDRMVLFRDPSEIDAAFAKALGDRLLETELWSLPIDVERRLFTDPSFVQATQFALQFFDAQLPLMPARMAQLRGGDEMKGAIESYGAFRYAENPMMNDGKRPIPPQIQQILDFYATYFLGLATLDQGKLSLAENFFHQTLDQIAQFEADLHQALEQQKQKAAPTQTPPTAGPKPAAEAKPESESLPYFAQYRWGALSNLGLIAEAQRDRAAALKYLNAPLPTGQAHGNQIRARHMLWVDPFATGPKDAH